MDSHESDTQEMDRHLGARGRVPAELQTSVGAAARPHRHDDREGEGVGTGL